MEFYRPRDVASTLILVGAVVVAITFTGNALPQGPLRLSFWVLLFFVTGALSPAPWIVPPASVVFFWIAVAVTPSTQGGCPANQLCEPIPNAAELFVYVSLLVLVSTFGGAALRTMYQLQKQLRSSQSQEPKEDLPP